MMGIAPMLAWCFHFDTGFQREPDGLVRVSICDWSKLHIGPQPLHANVVETLIDSGCDSDKRSSLWLQPGGTCKFERIFTAAQGEGREELWV